MDRSKARVQILRELTKEIWSEDLVMGILVKLGTERHKKEALEEFFDLLPAIAADVCGVELHKLVDRTRKHVTILAIKLVTKELYENYGHSYQRLADRFNRDSHVTIRSGIRDLNNRLETKDKETVAKFQLFEIRAKALKQMLNI